MNAILRIFAVAALLAALSACGNKGPLVQAPRPGAQDATAPEREQAPPAEPGPASEPAAGDAEPASSEPAVPPPSEADDGEP